MMEEWGQRGGGGAGEGDAWAVGGVGGWGGGRGVEDERSCQWLGSL